MSNEKITKEEIIEMLKGCELGDEALDLVAGGKDVDAYLDCYDNHPKKGRRSPAEIHKDCEHFLK